MTNGIVAELTGIKLRDKRLSKQSKKIIEGLSANPEASINASFKTHSETQAAYRFFSNDAVSPEEIHHPHREATIGRMQEQPVVLLVQDTTELNYTKHPPKDARCLNKEDRFGLYEHTSLAVAPNRLCLGVVDVESFDRDPDSLQKSENKKLERKALLIEDKESYRWLRGYRLACELAARCPGTQIVSVADREADIYDIYVEYRDRLGARAEYIIRANDERTTLERDPERGAKAYCNVREQVAKTPLFTEKTIELPATPKRAARKAHLEIRAMTVTLKPPATRPQMESVTHNVVLVQEVSGPGDGTDVNWLLFTTLLIDTADAVLTIINYYAARWMVEIYFHTLKSGCRVEEIQLEKVARLKRCLAFYRIIAWRVLHVTYLNRVSPELPCTAEFSDNEWKSVWRVVTKTEIPETPPTIGAFVRILTALGGYNNRAKERPPGAEVLWVSLRRMTDFAMAWLAFGPETRKSCV